MMRMCSLNRHQRHGFTLVEILVVIALIGVLAGILLVAVGGATGSARAARTKSTMESLSAAIDSFVLEHGELPGLVPVHVLHDADNGGGLESVYMTNTQNILLHLMGGARVSVTDDQGTPLDATAEAEYQRYRTAAQSEDDDAWFEFTLDDEHHPLAFNVIVRVRRIGEGPWIAGRSYPPYFSPKDHELLERWTMSYQDDNTLDQTPTQYGFTKLPDVADAWGQPIIVFKRDRTNGPVIVGPEHDHDDDGELPQIWLEGIGRYVGATALGSSGARQLCRPNEPLKGSRIGTSGETGEREYWLYLMLSHPALIEQSDYELLGDPSRDKDGTSRAGYTMLSAGPDGIYFSRSDGPGDPETGAPIEPSDFPADSDDPAYQNDHSRLQDFDDIVVYGGS